MAKKTKHADKARANGTASAPEQPSITKYGALREALQHLGPDAKNSDLEDYVVKKYGKEALTSNISVAKSSILSAMGKNPRRKKRRGRPAKQEQTQQSATVAAPASSAGISLEVAQTVKDLVGQLGAETVKGLADIFGGK